MTKKIKKSLLVASVLATVCTVSGAVVSMNPVEGVDASAESVSLVDFETNFGASVRVSEPNGLRFKLKLSQEKKDEIFAQGSNKTLGMFIFPKTKAFVGACDYASLAQKIDITFSEADLYKKDGYWYANGVNGNMYIQNFNLEFIGVGYIKTGDTYEYSDIATDENARSLSYVAMQAYKAGQATAKTAELIEKSVYAKYGIKETRTPGYQLTDSNTGDTWSSYLEMKEDRAITISVDENVELKQGQSLQLTPSFVVNEQTVDLADLPFTYSVEADNVICDKDGVVTGVTAGEANIVVKMGAYTATQTVVVTEDKYEKLGTTSYYANREEVMSIDLSAYNLTGITSLTIGGDAYAETEYAFDGNTLSVAKEMMEAKNPNGGKKTIEIVGTTETGSVTVGGEFTYVNYALGDATEFLAFYDAYANTRARSSIYTYVVLTNNIMLSDATLHYSATASKFYGVLDGQGYTVSNFFVVVNSMFYEIGVDGQQVTVVKNVGFIGAKRQISSHGSTEGGILATNIRNSIFENVYVEGSTDSTRAYTGALCDYMYGDVTLRNCFVEYQATSSIGGALASRVLGKPVVENCYAISNNAMGLYSVIIEEGDTDMSPIGRNFYTSAEAFKSLEKTLPKGFDGELWAMKDGMLTFKSTLGAWRTIEGEQFVANNRTDFASLKLDLGADVSSVSGVTVGGATANYTFENGVLVVPFANITARGNVEVYVSATTAKGALTVSAKAQVVDYAIGSVTELNAFRNGYAGYNNTKPYLYVVLTDNIDYSNGEYYGESTATGTFFGCFDGQGYTISNIKVKNSFFPSIAGIENGQRSIIKNFGLENVIKHTGNGGGLLANDMLDTDVDNVYVNGSVDVYTGSTSGAIAGTTYRTNVTNCVVKISTTNTNLPALVTNANTSLTIKNVYAIAQTNNANVKMYTSGSPTIINGYLYTTVEAFTTAVAEVPASFDDDLWVMADGALAFKSCVPVTIAGEQLVANNRADCLEFDLGAYDVTKVDKVQVGGNTVSKYTYENGKLSVSVSDIVARGHVEVALTTTTQKGSLAVKAKAQVVDYAIGSVTELNAFRNGYVGYNNTKPYLYVVLTDNINYSNGEYYGEGTATGTFFGCFDGQGYTISNIKVKNSFFPSIAGIENGQRSIIKNFGLENVIKHTGNGGGLLANDMLDTDVDNVYVNGIVEQYQVSVIGGENKYLSGAIAGTAYRTTVTNCVAKIEYANASEKLPSLIGIVGSGVYVENMYALLLNSTANSFNWSGHLNITNYHMSYSVEAFKNATNTMANVPVGFNLSYWSITADGIVFNSAV